MRNAQAPLVSLGTAIRFGNENLGTGTGIGTGIAIGACSDRHPRLSGHLR